jgi:hypothetical protein
VVNLAPHTCEIEDIVPRKKRTKISHLPQSVSSMVSSSVAVKYAGLVGGGTAKAVQSSSLFDSVSTSLFDRLLLSCFAFVFVFASFSLVICVCLVQSYYLSCRSFYNYRYV